MLFVIQEYLDKIMLTGLIAGGMGTTEGRQACYFKAAHSQQSKAVLMREVASHRSLLTFITSGIPTQFMKLTWSEHKIRVNNSLKHSVLQLFASETSQQNVLHESLDKIKRSCTKDHQKSQRTHQQFEKMSVHRVTDCLTQTNNKRGSISSQAPHEDVLEKNSVSIKKKGSEVDERRAESYSKQGNTDITEVAKSGQEV